MADDDPNQQNQPSLEQAEFDINDANTEADLNSIPRVAAAATLG